MSNLIANYEVNNILNWKTAAAFSESKESKVLQINKLCHFSMKLTKIVNDHQLFQKWLLGLDKTLFTDNCIAHNAIPQFKYIVPSLPWSGGIQPMDEEVIQNLLLSASFFI